MKNLLYVVLVLIFPTVATSQSVEIEGKLKVTQMDTINTENQLVVKQADGTLATRMLSSLPSPPDTSRSLQSDLLLTLAICNCLSLPPAMIQSLLNNGYSIQDLVDFQISNPDLLAAGVPVQDLLLAGLSVQDLLDANTTPLVLYDGGVIIDSLYGKTFGGGLYFILIQMRVMAWYQHLQIKAQELYGGVLEPKLLEPMIRLLEQVVRIL
jgi:hypothetical protein